VLARRDIDEAARRVRRSVPVALGRERARIARDHGRVDELARLRTRDAERGVERAAARVAERGRRITREASAAVTADERSVIAAATHQLEVAGLRLDSHESVTRALDPRRVLERGYSITRDDAGRVVRRAATAGAGTVIVTELADGRVTSRVESSEPTEAEA
jgi:exodeoxyribonuclease VII large subunit